MHQSGFLPAYLETKLGGFFQEDVEDSFEVSNCVTEQGGIFGILQVCQVVVAKSDFCDPLEDLNH